MIEFKKSELKNAILTIEAVKKEGDDTSLVGLLHEKITLGMKRRLQKIYTLLMKEYNQYDIDLAECKFESKEIELLNSEIVKIDVEKISLDMVDAIETSNNYSADIIEKISQ